MPDREVATATRQSDGRSIAVVGALSLCACAGLIGFLGFRLGSTELEGDPVSWVVTTEATTALVAGAVAGIGSGAVAIACRRLWTVSLPAWVLCAGILTGGWAYGMVSAGFSFPASDLQRVFVATLIFAVAPALGVSAIIYGIGWQFDRTPPPHLSQSGGHDDTV